MSTAAQRSPAGAVGYRSVGTLLSATGAWALFGGLPCPGKRRRRPSWPGVARGCQPSPRRYRPRTKAAAAVHAICSGQLTPSLFCGEERAREQGLREGEEGGRLWLPSATQRCREKAGRGSDPERHRLPVPGAPAALCTAQSLSRHGGKGMGREALLLSGPGSSLLQLPPPRLPLCFARPGDPAVRTRVRAGAAAGFSGGAPCPGTRALPRLEKPRP